MRRDFGLSKASLRRRDPERSTNHARAYSSAERVAIRAVRWLLDRSPRDRRGQLLALGGGFVLVTLPSLALLIAMVVIDAEEAEGWFRALGYAGVFIANLLSTATVFVPVPGLLAVGHGLIISESAVLSPFLVGLLGGLGMGLGESTAYVAGFAGAEAARQTRPGVPAWLTPGLDQAIRAVEWLMDRYGLLTLFVLAVIPDPVFEFAGIVAGATRIGFWRFMLVVVSGNCIRGLLVAYYGEKLLPFV